MNQMKSPGKLRRSEFATSEGPSELMVKLSDDTLTLELPETIVNCSPSLSQVVTPRVVVVDCIPRGRNGRTSTTGATGTRGRTLGMTSGVTTVCTDTTGSTETMGATPVRTDTSGAKGASGASGVGPGEASGAAPEGAFGAGEGAAGGGVAGGSAGSAGGCGAACCDGVEWMLTMVGRNAATRHTTGIAQRR